MQKEMLDDYIKEITRETLETYKEEYEQGLLTKEEYLECRKIRPVFNVVVEGLRPAGVKGQIKASYIADLIKEVKKDLKNK